MYCVYIFVFDVNCLVACCHSAMRIAYLAAEETCIIVNEVQVGGLTQISCDLPATEVAVRDRPLPVPPATDTHTPHQSLHM